MDLLSDVQLQAPTITGPSKIERPGTHSTTQSMKIPEPLFSVLPSPKPVDDPQGGREIVSKTALLEQCYTELLEKRIASLAQALEGRGPEDDDGEEEEEDDSEGQEDDRKVDDKETGDGKKPTSSKDADTNKVDSSEVKALIEDNDKNTADQSENPTEAINAKSSQVSAIEKRQEPGRIHFTELKYNKSGYFVVSDADQVPSAEKIEKKPNYAVVWSRVFDVNNKCHSTNIEIQSQPLAKVLKANLSHHSAFPHHDKVVRFRSPFEVVVQNWVKPLIVAESCLSDDDTQKIAREDMKHLMKKISTIPELVQYFEGFDPDNMPKTVSFNRLWTIFPPGCLIYSPSVMQKDHVVILQYSETEDSEENKKRFLLTCWAYDWNGETFSRVP